MNEETMKYIVPWRTLIFMFLIFDFNRVGIVNID